MAAQAGVRYSIQNPQSYFDSNILGFFNIIELCKTFKVKHFIFASSSSVYGDQKKNFQLLRCIIQISPYLFMQHQKKQMK